MDDTGYLGDLKFHHIYNFTVFHKIFLESLWQTTHILKKDKGY